MLPNTKQSKAEGVGRSLYAMGGDGGGGAWTPNNLVGWPQCIWSPNI